MSDTKYKLIQTILSNIEKSLQQVQKMIEELEDGNTEVSSESMENIIHTPGEDNEEAGEIIEGVFDGQQMIGPDGSVYSVPANYASKSKLVEGDLLKLTISPDGSFIYKQIKPVDRQRVIGKLVKDKEKGEFRVLVDKKLYKVLKASVTYYKGGIGDRVVILVPNGGGSTWGCVDNIIKAGMPIPQELEAELESQGQSQEDKEFMDIFEE